MPDSQKKPIGRPKERGPLKRVSLELSVEVWEAIGALAAKKHARSRTLLIEEILRRDAELKQLLPAKGEASR